MLSILALVILAGACTAIPGTPPAPAGAPAASASPAPTAVLAGAPAASASPVPTAVLASAPAASVSPLPTAPPVPVTLLPAAAPFDDRNLELSGLAWFGDMLVFLPQYPARFGDQIFAVRRYALLAALDAAEPVELTPQAIAFDDGGLAQAIPGFEGYEAIAFDGANAYLTIEARGGAPMTGYLVRGVISPDGTALRLDPGSLVTLQPQAALSNAGYESLVLVDGEPVTIFEANGAQVNPAPTALRFDAELASLPGLIFPTVEYRITDATAMDSAGRFWAINYFYPGDTQLLPASTSTADTADANRPAAALAPGEQLLEFQLDGGEIRRTGRAPIQLQLLADGTARNWEGVARVVDRGFIMVTDKFPTTLVAFVPFDQPDP